MLNATTIVSVGAHFSVLVGLSQIVSYFFFAGPPRHIGCPGTKKPMVNAYHTTEEVSLPSIFTWSEAFHPYGDSSVYQVLLRLIPGICKKLDEREESVCSSQCLYQVLFAIVVDNTPVTSGQNGVH